MRAALVLALAATGCSMPNPAWLAGTATAASDPTLSTSDSDSDSDPSATATTAGATTTTAGESETSPGTTTGAATTTTGAATTTDPTTDSSTTEEPPPLCEEPLGDATIHLIPQGEFGCPNVPGQLDATVKSGVLVQCAESCDPPCDVVAFAPPPAYAAHLVESSCYRLHYDLEANPLYPNGCRTVSLLITEPAGGFKVPHIIAGSDLATPPMSFTLAINDMSKFQCSCAGQGECCGDRETFDLDVINMRNEVMTLVVGETKPFKVGATTLKAELLRAAWMDTLDGDQGCQADVLYLDWVLHP